MNFEKYHALGNDYLVLDPSERSECLSENEIVRICHRNFGLGSDGILWGPVPSDEADFGLRILNPDGSEAVFQVSVSLSARVVGPFSFNPPYMSMGLVRPGQVLSRSVRLTCHDVGYDFAEHPPKVEIKGIAPANQPYPDWIYVERFTPRVTPVPGENAVDIELTCQGMPETLSGSFRGTLIVGLEHEEKSEVIIPITGVCRGGVVAPRPGKKPAGGK